MDRIIKPGNLVVEINDPSLAKYPLWGVVLPKDKFVQRFLKSRGETNWPTGVVLLGNKKESWQEGQERKGDFTDKWGHYMPTKKLNDHENMVLTPEDFIQDNETLGVFYFGRVFSFGIGTPEKGRFLDYEIRGKDMFCNVFDVKDLGVINSVRNLTFREAGANSRVFLKSAEYDLFDFQRYSEGEFKDMSLEKVRYNRNESGRRLVELLRDCRFPEGK